MNIEALYDSVVGKATPDLAYTTLDGLTFMFNRMDNPRKDVSDFILECAKAGVPGSATVCLTMDSISLVQEES